MHDGLLGRSWPTKTKTVLVIAGYGPIAEWIRDCLEGEGYCLALAGDANAAARMMMLIDVDMTLAWPAISACTVEDVLSVADGHGEVARVPVLFASWMAPHGLSPLDGWVKVPLGAVVLRRRVRELLNHDEPMNGSSRCRMPGSKPAEHVVRVALRLGATAGQRLHRQRRGAEAVVRVVGVGRMHRMARTSSRIRNRGRLSRQAAGKCLDYQASESIT